MLHAAVRPRMGRGCNAAAGLGPCPPGRERSRTRPMGVGARGGGVGVGGGQLLPQEAGVGGRWTDNLRAVCGLAMAGTLIATPSGTETSEWLMNKLKGGAVELAAVGA